MVLRLLLLVSVPACELVFPLRNTAPVTEDAPRPDDATRNDGLLTPPDGKTTCVAPPDFDSYQFESVAPPVNLLGIEEFGFFSVGGEASTIATTSTELYEISNGSKTLLLAAPANTSIRSPRPAYDTAVVWFQQFGAIIGTFFANRASGWMKQPANLGFIDAEAVQPGAVGFHDGTARMVVSVSEFAGSQTLHELSSTDGVSWTSLETIQFAPSGLGDRDPALSADGCYLLYVASPGSSEIRISVRDPDGVFRISQKLAKPSTLTTAPSFPVLTPDAGTLWFTSNVAGQLEFFRGQ